MKTLKDGTHIPARMWYYMLDFLDQQKGNGNYLAICISNLNKEEFSKLFTEATDYDKGYL